MMVGEPPKHGASSVGFVLRRYSQLSKHYNVRRQGFSELSALACMQ